MTQSTTSTRQLMVISYHFYTDGSVGGLRWAGLTKYLARAGWKCRIFTGAPTPASTPDGVVVQSVRTATTLLAGLVQLRRKLRTPKVSAPETHPPVSQSRTNSGTSTPAIRREMLMVLGLPDGARGWVLRTARQARRAVMAHVPDVVISSGPPHSAHLVAWLATRGTGVPWIADLRDPMTPPSEDWGRESLLHSTWVGKRFTPWLERFVMRRASRVLCNTKLLQQDLEQRYPRVRCCWLPNAVDSETLPPRQGALGPTIDVVHVGTLYGERNPSPVVDALRLAKKSVPGGSPIRFRVIGQVNAPYDRILDAARDDLGAESLSVEGTMPRDAALEIVTAAHIAVVLAQGQPLQVPAKLYETIAIAQAVVVVTERDSATWKESERLGAWVVEPKDIRGLSNYILQASRGNVNVPNTSQLYYHQVADQLRPVLAELSTVAHESMTSDTAGGK